jgi:hypothetical protein
VHSPTATNGSAAQVLMGITVSKPETGLANGHIGDTEAAARLQAAEEAMNNMQETRMASSDLDALAQNASGGVPAEQALRIALASSSSHAIAAASNVDGGIASKNSNSSSSSSSTSGNNENNTTNNNNLSSGSESGNNFGETNVLTPTTTTTANATSAPSTPLDPAAVTAPFVSTAAHASAEGPASSSQPIAAGDLGSTSSGVLNAEMTVNTGDPASRASVDSQQQASPGWAHGLAASVTAAAAMAGIPVNEQPLLPNHGPRMSNAVARKLGLAPPRHQTATGDVRFTRPRNGAPPQLSPQDSLDAAAYQPRGSVDSGSVAYANLTMPGTAPMVNTANGSLAAALAAGLTADGGVAAAAAAASQPAYPSSYPPTDSTNIHPALLNLVAANLGTAAGTHPGAVGSAAAGQQHSMGGPAAHIGSFAANGGNNGNGMHELAHLMASFGHLGLSGSHNNGNGGHHPSSAHAMGVNNGAGVPHRGSSDGMLGVSAVPRGPTMEGNVGHGGIAPFYFPADLDMFGHRTGGRTDA